MIRITLNVDNLPGTRFARMHNRTAPHRTVAAYGRCFFGMLGLKHLCMGFNRLKIKSQTTDCKAGSRRTGDLDKLPSRYVHKPPFLLRLSVHSKKLSS
jgi:hypothetical protein